MGYKSHTITAELLGWKVCILFILIGAIRLPFKIAYNNSFFSAVVFFLPLAKLFQFFLNFANLTGTDLAYFPNSLETCLFLLTFGI